MQDNIITNSLKNKNKKVAIIILNWNGKEDTIECLESLRHITYPNYEILLLDNGSTDGSVEYFKGRYPSIEIIDNGENMGFAKGNNVGITRALDKGFEYIMMLNNDTKVEPDFLSKLVEIAETDKDIGIVSPKILKMNNPKIIDSTGHILKWGCIIDRGSGEVDKKQYDSKNEITGAMAAACLYRGEMLKKIGLYDESFITTYEDAELSWRAYKNGWKAKFVPQSIVYHKRGATIKKDKEILLRLQLLSVRNRITMIKKHATPWQKFLFGVFITFYEIPFSVIRKIIGRNNIGIKPYIQSLYELCQR